MKICGQIWPEKVGSGQKFLTICIKSGQESGLVARKSGQLAIFENKSGHENLRKSGQNGLKMAKKGLKMAFLGTFWAKIDEFLISWPFGHFYS